MNKNDFQRCFQIICINVREHFIGQRGQVTDTSKTKWGVRHLWVLTGEKLVHRVGGGCSRVRREGVNRNMQIIQVRSKFICGRKDPKNEKSKKSL